MRYVVIRLLVIVSVVMLAGGVMPVSVVGAAPVTPQVAVIVTLKNTTRIESRTSSPYAKSVRRTLISMPSKSS